MGLFSPSPSPTPLPTYAVGGPAGSFGGPTQAPAPITLAPPPPASPASIPVFTPPPPDPAVAAATTQANNASIAALQQTAQMDSASILARYGQQMSMANAQAGSPLLAR